MQNFPDMDSLGLSSPKGIKAMNKYAFMQIRRCFLFDFFVVFFNCRASEQHAKGIGKLTPLGVSQLKT